MLLDLNYTISSHPLLQVKNHQLWEGKNEHSEKGQSHICPSHPVPCLNWSGLPRTGATAGLMANKILVYYVVTSIREEERSFTPVSPGIIIWSPAYIGHFTGCCFEQGQVWSMCYGLGTVKPKDVLESTSHPLMPWEVQADHPWWEMMSLTACIVTCGTVPLDRVLTVIICLSTWVASLGSNVKRLFGH